MLRRTCRLAPRRILTATAIASVMIVALAAPAAATTGSRIPQGSGIPVRITLDDSFGPNRISVPPLTAGGMSLTTETKVLKLRGYVDGTATIRLLLGSVNIRLTSANLVVDPIVLDDSSCPVIRTSPITIRLDPTKTSTASAKLFQGTASLTLNALVRASLVSDGSACGQPVIEGPYVERPVSQTTTGGTFRLALGVRQGTLMIGVVKGTATAPDTVLAACIAEGPAGTPCPEGGTIDLDPVTLTVSMAAWVGLR